jgi:hypothetical protein
MSGPPAVRPLPPLSARRMHEYGVPELAPPFLYPGTPQNANERKP